MQLLLNVELVQKRIIAMGYPSPKAFCIDKNFPYSTLRSILASERSPRLDTVAFLAENLQLPPVQLMTYRRD